jgi:hypothetical protein
VTVMLQVGNCAVVLASYEEGQRTREFGLFDSVVEMRPLCCLKMSGTQHLMM